MLALRRQVAAEQSSQQLPIFGPPTSQQLLSRHQLVLPFIMADEGQERHSSPSQVSSRYPAYMR